MVPGIERVNFIFILASNYDPLPVTLQQARIEILNLTTCNASYSDESIVVTTSQICAGSRAGGVDSCQVNCLKFKRNYQLFSFMNFNTYYSSTYNPYIYKFTLTICSRKHRII